MSYNDDELFIMQIMNYENYDLQNVDTTPAKKSRSGIKTSDQRTVYRYSEGSSYKLYEAQNQSMPFRKKKKQKKTNASNFSNSFDLLF